MCPAIYHQMMIKRNFLNSPSMAEEFKVINSNIRINVIYIDTFAFITATLRICHFSVNLFNGKIGDPFAVLEYYSII